VSAPVAGPVARLAAAEAVSLAARERLSRDLEELQARLDPQLLKRMVADQGREAGAVATAVARRNPAATAGAAGAVALLLFRRPLGRLFRRKHRVYPTVRAPDAPPTS